MKIIESINPQYYINNRYQEIEKNIFLDVQTNQYAMRLGLIFKESENIYAIIEALKKQFQAVEITKYFYTKTNSAVIEFRVPKENIASLLKIKELFGKTIYENNGEILITNTNDTKKFIINISITLYLVILVSKIFSIDLLFLGITPKIPEWLIYLIGVVPAYYIYHKVTTKMPAIIRRHKKNLKNFGLTENNVISPISEIAPIVPIKKQNDVLEKIIAEEKSKTICPLELRANYEVFNESTKDKLVWWNESDTDHFSPQSKLNKSSHESIYVVKDIITTYKMDHQVAVIENILSNKVFHVIDDSMAITDTTDKFNYEVNKHYKMKLINWGEFITSEEAYTNSKILPHQFEIIGKETIGKYEVTKIIVKGQEFYTTKSDDELNKSFFVSGRIDLIQVEDYVHPEWDINYVFPKHLYDIPFNPEEVKNSGIYYELITKNAYFRNDKLFERSIYKSGPIVKSTSSNRYILIDPPWSENGYIEGISNLSPGEKVRLNLFVEGIPFNYIDQDEMFMFEHYGDILIDFVPLEYVYVNDSYFTKVKSGKDIFYIKGKVRNRKTNKIYYPRGMKILK